VVIQSVVERRRRRAAAAQPAERRTGEVLHA